MYELDDVANRVSYSYSRPPEGLVVLITERLRPTGTLHFSYRYAQHCDNVIIKLRTAGPAGATLRRAVYLSKNIEKEETMRDGVKDQAATYLLLADTKACAGERDDHT